MFESISTVFAELVSSIISSIIGINLKDIEKTLNKTKIRDSGSNEISESIDTVSKKLQDSKAIIDNALMEMDKQKKLFEQMRKEAEISKQIASMNEEQVAAMNSLLEKTITSQDKKSSRKNWLWNLFFCILSAILGFLLGKYF